MSTPSQSLAFERAEKRAREALASGRFTIRELQRGLIHVIDSRTSEICLDLARRKPVVGMDEEFETLIGPQLDPPFHFACRSLVVLVVPGDVEPHGAEEREVQAEERARDEEPPPRRPSRKDRRNRRREINRDVERRRREERERKRREREAARERQRGQQAGTLRDRIGTSDELSTAPKSRQSGQPLREGDRPLPAALRPQRTSLREWVDSAAELNREFDRRADDDEAMRILLRRQRWSGAPVVVDAARFAVEESRSGGPTLHRGISPDTRSAGDYAQEFARGHLFLGRGAGGVGVYTSTDPDLAREYAGSDGAVVRAVPLAGARYVGVEELLAARERELATLTEREQRSLRVLTEDPGRLAVALGYDAVRYPDGIVLVVNRTALAVEEP